ncbi:MAG: ACT domain-containing protein [Planctomycetota bacterium]|nr:ACT domain-containing protein [Planctomycetota bacterium]
MAHSLSLSILPGSYCICKLAPADMASPWIAELFDSERSSFSCFTRTQSQLSLVCERNWPPATVKRESDFAILKLGEQFDFQQIGLFLSVAKPLADANISILPIATFDTDYVMIKQRDMPAALDALLAAGHSVS